MPRLSHFTFNKRTRLVYDVIEEKEIFKQITVGFIRYGLDAGVNPKDTICMTYSDLDYKLVSHKIDCLHPDLRTEDPSSQGDRRVPADYRIEKWKLFKIYPSRCMTIVLGGPRETMKRTWRTLPLLAPVGDNNILVSLIKFLQ